jgi:signal transduction histidine kinase
VLLDIAPFLPDFLPLDVRQRAAGLRGRLTRLGWLCVAGAVVLTIWAGAAALAGWPSVGAPRGVLLRETRDRLADQLSLQFTDQAALGRMLGGIPAERRAAWMVELTHDHPRIWNIVVSDPSGHIVAQARPMEGGAMALADVVVPVGRPVPEVGPSTAAPDDIEVAPELVRSADLTRLPTLVGVSSTVPGDAPGAALKVTILTSVANLPNAGPSIGPSLLLTDDGVLLTGEPPLTHFASVLQGLAQMRNGLPEASAVARTILVPMEDGNHRFMVRKLGGWPASVVINAGPAPYPRAVTSFALPCCLLLSAVLLLLLGLSRGTRPGILADARSAPLSTPMPAPLSAPLRAAAGRDLDAQRQTARRLASGLAHEINNVLTMLSLDAELVGVLHPADPGLAALSRSMLGATARGTAMTQGLLAYAERAMLRPRSHDLCALTRGHLGAFRKVLQPEQLLTCLGAQEEYVVHVDAEALIECITALVRNAAEASGPCGEIRIELSQIGDAAVLVVDDAGPGMAGAVLDRAMDPGFSTKQDGRHLGMGLAAAAGFVRQSGGSLRLESKPGLGTRAFLRLPLERDKPVGHQQDSPAPVLKTPPADHAARPMSVLLVEDNEAVRSSIARHLRLNGYTVHESSDAERALPLLTRGVDLLVADIVLDGTTDGWALATLARQHDAQLPLVFMSGFLTARHPDLLTGDDLASFLRKPVSGAELAAVIAGLLALRETKRAAPTPRA